MGLDGVELVMDVEDRFDTSIPDSAADQIQTVGDLHEFLMDRIRDQNSARCPSAALFYPIRRILVDHFKIERSAIHPSTPLETIIHGNDRHTFWRKLESTVSTRLPRLKRTKWLQWNGDTFPESCTTVRQLVNHCVDVNRITEEFGPDDTDAVWETVCELVAKMAAVEQSTIKLETNFVRDLWF